jgi:hypothetical protein
MSLRTFRLFKHIISSCGAQQFWPAWIRLRISNPDPQTLLNPDSNLVRAKNTTGGSNLPVLRN